MKLRKVDVSVLRLREGDTVLMHLPEGVEPDGMQAAMEDVRAALNDSCPFDVPLLVLWQGVRFEIVRPTKETANGN